MPIMMPISNNNCVLEVLAAASTVNFGGIIYGICDTPHEPSMNAASAIINAREMR
jgi:hypothetical protein